MVNDEDKAFLCEHRNKKTDYCEIIRHYITNGFASRVHCSKCKSFVKKED